MVAVMRLTGLDRKLNLTALGAVIAATFVLASCATGNQDAAALLTPAAGAPAQPRSAEPANSIVTGALPAKSAVAPDAEPVVTPVSGVDAQSNEYYIDFDPNSVSLSDREKKGIRDALKDHMASGAMRIRLLAARGGMGNEFDQAIIAEKRARLVNEILPAKVVESVEFDPTLPEDTVLIEFHRHL